MGNKLLTSGIEDGVHSELSWEEVENEIDNEYDFLETDCKLFNAETNSTVSTISSKFGTAGIQNCVDLLSVTSSAVTSPFHFGDIENVTFEVPLVPPFKEERLFRGHTRRRSYLTTHASTRTISTRGGFSVKYEDGSTEIGVTAVDSFFGKDFLAGLKNSLNKGYIFDEVVSMLEANAITKKCVYNSATATIERIYSVPFAAHQLFLPEAISDAYSRMPDDAVALGVAEAATESQTHLLYMGRKYDIKFIYVFNATGRIPLTPIGLYHPPSALADCSAAVKLDYTVLNLPRNLFRGCAHLDSGGPARYRHLNGWQQPCETACLTIDLGSFRHVTHIVTAGRYPQLDRFPKREHTSRPRSRKRWRWQRRPDPESDKTFVHIVRPEEGGAALAWVTSYSVWYRARRSRQWICLGDFAGNTDCTGERAHSLFHHFNSPGGLCTRYLRFLPTGHVNQPAMRVAVYGNRELEDPTSTQRKEEGDVPTKDYVISEPMFKAHDRVRDGLFTFYKGWDREKTKGDKAKRTREVRRHMLQDARETAGSG